MSLASPSPANHWFEPAADSTTMPARLALVQDGSGDWVFSETDAAEAVVTDDGSGNFALVLVSDPAADNTPMLNFVLLTGGDIVGVQEEQ